MQCIEVLHCTGTANVLALHFDLFNVSNVFNANIIRGTLYEVSCTKSVNFPKSVYTFMTPALLINADQFLSMPTIADQCWIKALVKHLSELIGIEIN